MNEKLKNLIKKYEDDINKNIFLPIFIESLIDGGIELFDKLRTVFEDVGVDFKSVDFTRLK